MDDEPFTFERTLEIFKVLEENNPEVTPALIQKIFELNSKLAWKVYREKYEKYILQVCGEYPDDEYINYLAAIVYYDRHIYDKSLHCINKAISENPSSANYTHIKSLCLMQSGELETARTYLYQSLFLVELKQSVPPRKKETIEIYPNYPIEFHTSAELIRSDLKKIDRVEYIFTDQLIPLLD
jgi:tetratricopeptide (TPR) repeat protein